MTDEDREYEKCIDSALRASGKADLAVHHSLHTFLSKLDPDLCYYSGIRYKSELDDCGLSVDGHTKGNGWKVRISWEDETHTLWSPNLKALLNGALDFLKERVKVDED